MDLVIPPQIQSKVQSLTIHLAGISTMPRKPATGNTPLHIGPTWPSWPGPSRRHVGRMTTALSLLRVIPGKTNGSFLICIMIVCLKSDTLCFFARIYYHSKERIISFASGYFTSVYLTIILYHASPLCSHYLQMHI